jgi:DNA-directed RNA polymerase subunit RPC12/RpoP
MSRNKYQTRTPQIKIRDPEPGNRDPEPERREYTPRRLIRASMPTVCPDCGGNTRMADGRHVDQVRQRVLEYRTCARCGAKLAAQRDMTADEKERLCGFAEAIAEYERIKSD